MIKRSNSLINFQLHYNRITRFGEFYHVVIVNIDLVSP